MSDKKIPTPKEFLKAEAGWVNTLTEFSPTDYLTDNDIYHYMKEYAKEVVKYTLEQAVEKGKASNGGTWKTNEGHLESNPAYIRKESILLLEGEIIKQLGL